MKKFNKLFTLLVMIMMLTSMFTLMANAEETEATTETDTTASETTDADVDEETCEVSTNASIVISLDSDYLLTVGEEQEVLSLEGLSQESLDILSTVLDSEGNVYDFTTLTVTEIIDILVAASPVDTDEDGNAEETELSLTVLTDNEALLNAVGEILSTTYVDAEVELELEELCDEEQPAWIVERFANAEYYGITPGKMHLIEKYIDSLDLPEGTELTEEEIAALAESKVKDIIKGTKANKNAHKLDTDDNSDNTAETTVADESEDTATEDVATKSEIESAPKKEQKNTANSKSTKEKKNTSKSNGNKGGKKK